MGIYYCEGCDNMVDNDKVPQCVNELCEECDALVEDWEAKYNPKPIPSRADDWDYVHKDYDGAPDSGDTRCGTARSEMSALLYILDYEREQEYKEWKRSQA